MIKIYYSNYNKRLNENAFNHHISSLPLAVKDKILRFRNWQDAHACLYGKLLLQKGLAEHGFDHTLDQLAYTDYHRPYFANCIDFNISHSGYYVLCAFSSESTIGVDIEEVKAISLDDFQDQWTSEEWFEITHAIHKMSEFYKFWTMKEAVIKADGKGLSIPLKSFSVKGGQTEIEGRKWFLTKLDLAENYIAHLASPIEKPEIIIEEVIL